MNSNLEHSTMSALCKECGEPLETESSRCSRCQSLSFANQAHAIVCRHFALGNAVLFAFVLIATKERTWTENLPIVIGFSAVTLLTRSVLGYLCASSENSASVRVSSWSRVLAGLAGVGVIDWLIRTDLIWAMIGFSLIVGTVFVIFKVLRSSRLNSPNANTVPAGAPAEAAVLSPEPQSKTSGSASGSNWVVAVIVAIAIAALKGQFKPPVKQPGNAMQRQANVQVASSTERFWNEQIIPLAQIERLIPEPTADQSFGDYSHEVDDYLANGIAQIRSDAGSEVAVDAVNLFNRHRNDLVELRATVIAVRTKSTSEELHRLAVDVAAAGDAAIVANTVPADDPAAAALLALMQRIERHELELAVLRGKLSERFPTCKFELPE